MDTSRTLQPGSMLFNGHYRIVSVLGRGGFGITYLAVVENLDKQVAIKEFFPRGMYNRDDVSGYVSVSNSDNDVLVTKLKAKFIKEARRLASLSHDSIVAVSNAFEENGTAYYVMDFIDGRDLQRIVRNNGPLPVDVAVGYIRQVGSALDYLHSLRINHLDVKPANILVDTAHNRAILIDFGLSKQYDSDDRQTSTTPVGVSHGYAPGEQYVPGGVKHFSAPTDVYSLAATLYFMLVGERPPSANELTEQPLVFPAGIPYYIQTAISKAMRNARSDRYPTVAAFLAALRSEGDNLETVKIASEPGRSKHNNRFSSLIWPLITAAIVATGLYLIFMARHGVNDEYLTDTAQVKPHQNSQVVTEPDSLAKLKQAAERGDAEAQNDLAKMYHNGDGVDQDDKQALYWFQKAAEQGFAKAQYNLGLTYYNGDGVEQDLNQALYWYRKAAEQGFAQAQSILGYMYNNGDGVKQDYKQALHWYRKAAEQGDADAQSNLGVMYYNGDGVKQDFNQAAYWIRKAAEQGNAEAQNSLGVMYHNDYGVKKDDNQAVYWYRKAAEQGHAKAQLNLGWMYQNGYGVDKDDNQAAYWYRKSAEQGFSLAQNLLDEMRGKGLIP